MDHEFDGQKTDPTSEAFEELWSQCREDVFRACLAWTGGRISEAEDALSTVGVAAHQRLRTVRRPRQWLLRVAHNACMDRHRAQRRRGEQSLFDAEGQVIPDVERTFFERACGRTPETECLGRELRRYVGRCIEELPDRLRETMCRKLRHQSYREISRELGITEANARKRIQQAREILRQRLVEYEGSRRAP